MRPISVIRTTRLFAVLLLLNIGSLAGSDTFPATRSRLFDVGSLQGSYASVGRAGSGVSVSVGVAEFDGHGNVTRFVRVNAGAEDGGRILLDITSVGSYSVNADGTGVIEFTNTLPSGATANVTYDFVITRSVRQAVRDSMAGGELFAIQREPGVTASPVTETFSRR